MAAGVLAIVSSVLMLAGLILMAVGTIKRKRHLKRRGVLLVVITMLLFFAASRVLDL